MLRWLRNVVTNQSAQQRRSELYRNLIRHEAKIGGAIFGKAPAGHRREFFCLDRRTWVWHEEWTDQHGQVHVQTTRYDVRPHGIFKSQGGGYHLVKRDEALRLQKAINQYSDRVSTEMYSFAR